jgi:cyanophycin synthetase
VGLDIAGVDVVAPEIGQPLEQSGGVVVEVNAGPGLRMHLQPSAGAPRPVGEAIVGMLFPRGGSGQIPLAAVVGAGGPTARLLAHLLTGAGHLTGLAGADGLFVGARPISPRGGPQGVQAVLLHPRVTAAVLQTHRGKLLREGLGVGQCDVAVLVGVAPDAPLGEHVAETLEDHVRSRRVVAAAVSPAGSVVLDASDPLAAVLASACPGSAVYFAQAENGIVAGHRARGGRAVLLRQGWLVFAHGRLEETVLPLSEIVRTHGEQGGIRAEDVLAAAAAAWALGLSTAMVRTGLATFVTSGAPTPARC